MRRRRQGGRLRSATLVAALATATATAIALVSGCGQDVKPSNQFLNDQALRTRVDRMADRFDFSAKQSAGQEVNMEVAHERLLRRCLRQSGVPIGEPNAHAEVRSVLPQVSKLDLWLSRGETLGLGAALSDPAELQKHRRALDKSVGHKEVPYPPGAERLVNGDPPVTVSIPLPGGGGGSVEIPVGGCFGQATKDLYGVPAEQFERVRMALPRVDDILSQSVADNRVDDLLGSYHVCMQAASLDIESPAFVDEPLFKTAAAVIGGSQQPSAMAKVENEVLAADKKCKSSSGVGSAFAQSFLDHGAKALASTEGVVEEYKKMIDHAQAVVASPAYADS